MIVRKHLSLYLIYFYTRKQMSYALLLSFVVTFEYYLFGSSFLPNMTAAVSILGISLSFLLSFRNSAAYDRWWEARRIWGDLMNQTRSFATQVLTLIDVKFDKEGKLNTEKLKSLQKEILYRQIAFNYALTFHLRRQPHKINKLKDFLPEDEFLRLKNIQNIPNFLLLQQSKTIQNAYNLGYTEDFRHIQFDKKITLFFSVLGGCERIKNTIFPRQYSYYSEIALWIFLTLLPWALIKELGYYTPFISFVISFFFVILGYIGNNIEKPFANSVNDTPITQLSRQMEIDLKEMLGEDNLPEPIRPIKGYLY
ncbi:MAG: hypothetical protein EAY69_07375 [Cytophagales bacterium]|nr:MAG: hypothetical protein EAY69_07375 [Cytophagales bacterium]